MPDFSHPGIEVRLDACIQCTRCVRACREVQVNDVIGYAGRGSHAKIVFDIDDPMGDSTCVGCGECVQACPTGALLPALIVDRPREQERPPIAPHSFAIADAPQTLSISQQPTISEAPAAGWTPPDTTVPSLCPYCGVGCQTTYHVRDNRILRVIGRDGPSNHGRLCVKGRFGFDYVHHPQRLTNPLIRREGVPKERAPADRSGESVGSVSRSNLGRSARCCDAGPQAHPRRIRPASHGRLRLREGQQRRSVPLPEARAHRLRHQQRRPLHAPLPRIIRRRTDGRPELRRRVEPGRGRAVRRRDLHDRREPDGESSGRRDVHEERDRARHQAHPCRPAPHRACRDLRRIRCSSAPTPTSRCSTR